MKKTLMAIAAMLFYCTAFAYVPGSRIDSVRDYMTAKIVYEFLKDVVTPSDSRYASFKEIEIQFAANSLEEPLPIGTLSMLLINNNFEKTNQFVERTKDIRVPVNSIIDSIPALLVASFINICGDSPSDLTNQYLLKAIERIKPYLVQNASRYFLGSDTSVSPTTVPIDETAMLTKNTIPFILLLIALLVFIFKYYYLKWKKAVNTSAVQNPDISLTNKKLQKELDLLKQELQKLKDEIQSKSKQNELQKIDNEKLQKTVHYLETQTRANNSEVVERRKPKEPPKKQPETIPETIEFETPYTAPQQSVFYMSNPEKDFFPVNRRSEDYDPGKVLYKFFQSGIATEAEFEFISDDESIVFVRTDNMQLINPACKAENKASVNTKRVVTIKRGKARLEDNKWVIKEKSLIRFDSTEKEETKAETPGKPEPVLAPAKNTTEKETAVTANKTETPNDIVNTPKTKTEKSVAENPEKKQKDTADNRWYTFYMGVPLDNSFTISSISDKYIEGLSMYKFETGHDQNVAEFEFISDSQSIKLIQNNNLEVVRPACKLENEPSPKTNKVITTQPGTARYFENKWEIIEKARIRFENSAVPPPTKKETAEKKAPQNSIFYAGAPNGNAFQSYSISDNHKVGYSLFKLQINPTNKLEAFFEAIVDNEILKMVRNNSLSLLENACILVNNPSVKTNKIITKEPGIAKRNTNNDWEITRQATIEFDNPVPSNLAPQSSFYASIPVENSFTNTEISTEYVKGRALYKFSPGLTKDVANFEFISDSVTINSVQNNRLDNIKAACELENVPTKNTAKIITTREGLVRLENDKWVIYRKAKVKFE